MPSLDDVAATLYALKPEEFSSARDAEVKKARQAGDKQLAKEIGQLRKPTQSAWLVNLLWRDQHEVIEQLFELANELSKAQAEAAGQELRSLAAQRRQIESALLRRATELARDEGVNVSEATQREAQETLSAALARTEVADEVRSGRLVKAASYAGFGELTRTTAPTATRTSTPRPTPREPIDLRTAQRARDERARDDRDAERARDERDAEREREREREREEQERQEREQREAAQRRLDQAQRAAESANAQLERATRAQREARTRRDDLRQQLRALREQVQRVETEVEEAERQSEGAERERDEAEATHSAALKQLAEAERALTT